MHVCIYGNGRILKRQYKTKVRIVALFIPHPYRTDETKIILIKKFYRKACENRSETEYHGKKQMSNFQ